MSQAERARRWERRWYGAPPGPLLRLPALLFAGISVLRRRLYQGGWLAVSHPGVPVIVVGNLTVGGTGKTPCTAWLAGELRQAGWRPGIVSRGHGGRLRGPHLLQPGDEAGKVGDEPLLLMRETGCPVSIGRDRPAAARLLLGQGCDVVIADDGLQHYRLGRDIEIAVVDGRRGFGNGALLPAGPLREPAGRLADCDFVLVNGGAGSAATRLPEHPGRWPVAVRAGELRSLDGQLRRPLASLAGQRVRLLAGIGHPARLVAELEAAGLVVEPLPVADHGRVAATDLAAHPDLPLLMTAKDAVKYPALARQDCWIIEARLEVPAGLAGAILARLPGSPRAV
ncbi:MAG: tetraacyldisaccharide 4'-kinase [Chromatiales bacterium]|nr:tetraacyldisaccharide 4'-kinase [Chromatiales bacterium]